MPNFIKIGQDFNFGNFFGGTLPKKSKFFYQKSSDQNFDIIFGLRTFENLCIPNFSRIG